ncbi:restriction endonuclease subunit S [Fusobacterium varium]
MKIKLEKAVEFINPIPVKKSEIETKYKVVFPAGIVDSKIKLYEFGETNLKKQIENKYFLKKNDILLQVKGNKFDSILITEEKENLLAGNSYLILRPNIKIVNPKYLQWYLKTKVILNYFEKNTSGAIIKLLRKATVAELIINLPSIEKQNEIALMIKKFELEKEALTEYLIDKESLIETVIMEKYGEEY